MDDRYSYNRTATAIHARQGCPKCVGKYKRSTADFIAEANAIHYDDYDYSKVDFQGVDKPVTIICNRCGLEFQQLAYSHLKNKGCACCSESKGERAIRYFLDEYAIQYERNDPRHSHVSNIKR